ncbi:MAG: HAD family hydrolase [Dysgonamonadaceae bacterium]|jgi:putative hydrolase of the HAD superfamily|nr:HAD family hydrolase [Dysgonamonadaceae bacterium]
MNWNNRQPLRGLLFDYGGTIDTNGRHWAEVLWDAYVSHEIPVSKEAFREAYIQGERYLATHPVIRPCDTFRDVLTAKTQFQIQWLIHNGFLIKNAHSSTYPLMISNQCYTFAQIVLQNSVKVLQKLASQFPLGLVSNFYGNLETVLNEFGLSTYFQSVVESAVVNVRKPDPAIFDRAVKALGMQPGEVAVIGDSYSKDIVPAHTLGCRTVWLKGDVYDKQDTGTAADAVIQDLNELLIIFNVNK